MKTQTLKFSELGQRLKNKLLLLCTSIILFSGACKKELYDSSIAPPSQKNRFINELYNNLLKNDAQYQILDQLQPSDKLGWERMMVRFKGGKTAPFNYVLPVINQGAITDRLIQFSFSSENKLVNISLLSYDNNLRLPIASDSLNSRYVKNQQTGNILACMSKTGLVVSEKLTKRALTINSFDQQKIAADKNQMQPKVMALPKEGAGKPIRTNANVMTMNNGTECTTTVDFDFLYTFTYDNVSKVDPSNYYDLAVMYFAASYRDYFNRFGYRYLDSSSPYINQITFFGLSEMDAILLVREALYHAATQTSMRENLHNGYLSYYLPRASTNCPVTPPTEPQDFRNNVIDPCMAKTVNSLLTSNMNIEGAMSEIIKKFDQTKTVTINIYDGEIYYKDSTIPKPGETSNQKFIGNEFSANITLGKTYHMGTSKENVVTTLIHEVVHAYLGYSSNNLLRTEGDHNVIASKYISPMADYLAYYFNVPLKDAYALAWSGVPDSKAWSDAPMDFEFTMSDGSKITKSETMYLSAPYKDLNTEKDAKGAPICQ